MHFCSAIVITCALSLVTADELALLDLGAAAEGLLITLSSGPSHVAGALRRRRGRPRKFSAPSRAVTLTLPETVLETLLAIDPDPSRAVVQLARRRGSSNGRAVAELAVFGGRAVISVRPTPSLERRTGVKLVPLPDGRALISFDDAKTIAEIELMLYDALDDPDLPNEDRKVFEAIATILKDARRSSDVQLINRSIIVLESSNGSRRPAASKSAGKRVVQRRRNTRAV
jgi:hypothetical protein